MEPLRLSPKGVTLHPAVTPNSPMAAQMNNVLRLPRTALAALHPVVEAVRLTAAPLTQTTGPVSNDLATSPLRRDRRSLLPTT
jgi:hypothetical protein